LTSIFKHSCTVSVRLSQGVSDFFKRDNKNRKQKIIYKRTVSENDRFDASLFLDSLYNYPAPLCIGGGGGLNGCIIFLGFGTSNKPASSKTQVGPQKGTLPSFVLIL
jgi:hypothetical protein